MLLRLGAALFLHVRVDTNECSFSCVDCKTLYLYIMVNVYIKLKVISCIIKLGFPCLITNVKIY